MNALPPVLCSDAALMPLVGFKAQQVRQGICQRGAARPDTLAQPIVTWHVRDLEAVCNGSMRALAKARVLGTQVTGMADGTDLETTARYRGCGQVTRQVRLEDTHGRVHASEGTVYGWTVLLLIDAATKIPLAVTVGKMHAHAALWTRAWVTQARLHLAGATRLHTVIFEKGFWDGSTLWWLDQPGITCVVPAKTHRAVTAEARAQAAAGAGRTVGHRVHTVRHGQGRGAWTERLATEVVGITGLTPDDPYGTPKQRRQANRRDFQAHPLQTVVVRPWQGKDDGPGGKTVLLTNAPVDTPLRPFADDADRSLMENCCMKEAKQPWDLGPPPQKTARAVRVHVVCTRLRFALATAYRWQCEREAMGSERVGWQRWRRQLLEQTREKVMVVAQGHYGIFPLAADSLLVGVKLTDVPPDIGGRQQVLAQYALPAWG